MFRSAGGFFRFIDCIACAVIGRGLFHVRARTWRQALAACGLKGVRIHDLRHTAASLAIAQGADVKVVQRMLGHATAAMTLDLYAGLFDLRLDEVAEALDGEL